MALVFLYISLCYGEGLDFFHELGGRWHEASEIKALSSLKYDDLIPGQWRPYLFVKGKRGNKRFYECLYLYKRSKKSIVIKWSTATEGKKVCSENRPKGPRGNEEELTHFSIKLIPFPRIEGVKGETKSDFSFIFKNDVKIISFNGEEKLLKSKNSNKKTELPPSGRLCLVLGEDCEVLRDDCSYCPMGSYAVASQYKCSGQLPRTCLPRKCGQRGELACPLENNGWVQKCPSPLGRGSCEKGARPYCTLEGAVECL